MKGKRVLLVDANALSATLTGVYDGCETGLGTMESYRPRIANLSEKFKTTREQDVSSVVAKFSNLSSRFYKNEDYIGQTQNIALGISRANGKYVAVLCDDNLWHPNFLSTMVAALEHRAGDRVWEATALV